MNRYSKHCGQEAYHQACFAAFKGFYQSLQDHISRLSTPVKSKVPGRSGTKSTFSRPAIDFSEFIGARPLYIEAQHSAAFLYQKTEQA